MRPMLNLLPGDVFCAHGNMAVVSAMIRWAERIQSKDNEAHYGHSGIIIDHRGRTLETGWTVREGHLDEYRGQRIIIARPMQVQGRPDVPITLTDKSIALVSIKTTDMGRWYPLWRLPMHLIPPLAKYLSTGRNLVCSERVAKYLQMIGARKWPYTGVNPDDLADEWHTWSNYRIVFEGVWQ